jgi:hypothetical protein
MYRKQANRSRGWEGSSKASSAAALPSGGRSPSHGVFSGTQGASPQYVAAPWNAYCCLYLHRGIAL